MDNGTAVTWNLTNGCSWTPHSRPREIIQNEQWRLSNNKSKCILLYNICHVPVKVVFLVVFLAIEEWWLVYKSSIMREKKNGIGFHFYWSATTLTPSPFPFSIKSESQHYPSDGLISLCAVMQRETEYQIRFNINLSWKRCICMKQKTAFHDYSFSDKIFIAAHIRSWVSHMRLFSILCQILRVKFTPNFCVP